MKCWYIGTSKIFMFRSRSVYTTILQSVNSFCVSELTWKVIFIKCWPVRWGSSRLSWSQPKKKQKAFAHNRALNIENYIVDVLLRFSVLVNLEVRAMNARSYRETKVKRPDSLISRFMLQQQNRKDCTSEQAVDLMKYWCKIIVSERWSRVAKEIFYKYRRWLSHWHYIRLCYFYMIFLTLLTTNPITWTTI